MTITPGRVVLYMLTDNDAKAINRRRNDARRSNLALNNTGAVVHFGNPVMPGDVFPMVVVRTITGNPGMVNGQVLLDGNDTLWATSVTEGIDAGTWSWPPRV